MTAEEIFERLVSLAHGKRMSYHRAKVRTNARKIRYDLMFFKNGKYVLMVFFVLDESGQEVARDFNYMPSVFVEIFGEEQIEILDYEGSAYIGLGLFTVEDLEQLNRQADSY